MKADDTTRKPDELTEAEIEAHGEWLEKHGITLNGIYAVAPCQPNRAARLTGAYQEPGAVLVSGWPVRELV